MIRRVRDRAAPAIAVRFENRRSISMKMDSFGRITVSAPLGMPREKVGAFIDSHRSWIDKTCERFWRTPYFEDTPENRKELARKAAKVLFEKVERFSRMMNLHPEKITVRFSETRFGSCTSRKTISFSAFLMLYPEKAVDCVVVHELAHLKHMNHSKEFYALVTSVLPDYKETVKLLRP